MIEFIESPTNFYLGRHFDPTTGEEVRGDAVYYDSRDLTTHGIVVGMTGSGKTGLCIDILEEAVIDGIPAIIVDPKGDITNLLLAFPDLSPQSFRPWLNQDDASRAGMTIDDYADYVANQWREGLANWGIAPTRLEELRNKAHYSIYTPGSDAGLPISILQSLRAPTEGWYGHEELLREKISGTVTALLALIGMSVNPVEDREHILMSNIFEHSWMQGIDLTLESLILQVQRPPFGKMGVFDVETLFPEKDRFKLAQSLNNIIASPRFQSWITGEPLDVQSMLWTPDGRPRVSVLYTAHLNDAERDFIMTLLLENVLTWMRTLQGTGSLRALLYIDEVFGMFPPYPYNPPTKEPMLRLLKQARAFGIGLLLATQNPGDLDYKGLSNAGTWFIGKLQTENDKKRILEGLDNVRDAQSNLDVTRIDHLISSLGPRQFILHNVHDPDSPRLMRTRWAMSFLRGPITRDQIAMLMANQKQQLAAYQAPAPQQPAIGYAPPQQGGGNYSTQTPQYTTEGQYAAPPPGGVTPQQVPARPPTTQAPSAVSSGLPSGFNVIAPVLESAINQFYIPVSKTVEAAIREWEESTNSFAANVETRKRLLYRPVLIGQADVRFEDKSTNTGLDRAYGFLVGTLSQTGRIDWGDYVVPPFDPARLEPNPLTDSYYADVPAPLKDKSNYKTLQTDMVNWIFQSASITVFWNPTLRVSGAVGGTRRDFLVEIQGVARQKRDEEADAVAKRYDKKLEALEDRAEAKARQLSDKRSEHEARKREELITGAETLMQLAKGRSHYALSRTSRLRRYTNSSGDTLERYEEQLREMADSLDETEAEMEQVLQEVQDKWSAIAADVQERAITPYKKDIIVSVFGLGWVPYWDVMINTEQYVLPAAEHGGFRRDGG